MIWYSRLSKLKKMLLLLVAGVLLIYAYAYYAESSCIREVFLNRINESTIFDVDTTILFLSQNKFLSPFGLFTHDVEEGFLTSTQLQYKNYKIVIRQASDAFYFQDTSKIIGGWYSGFRDKLTNEFGIMINVGPIIWLSPISIKVPLKVSGGPSNYSAFCIFTFNGIVWKITDWEAGPMTNNLCPLINSLYKNKSIS